jgi:L-malate glycosyltransferase
VKVLYLSHTAQVSGAERALLTLLAELPHRVDPVVACPDGPLAAAVAALGVPVVSVAGTDASLRLHPLHTPRALADMARTMSEVHGVARRTQPDIVHANSSRAGIIAAGSRRIGGPPVLVHLQDRLPPGMLSTATRWVLEHGTDGILACSTYVVEPFGKLGESAFVRVVHNPVDTERFDPDRLDRAAARARLGLRPDHPALVMVAQLTPWKAQDDAIRMLAALRGAHPEVRLVLVGSAKFVSAATRYDNLAYERSLDDLIGSLRLDSHVLKLGERADIPEILRACDLFLSPSWEEPFSLSMLEAMAMALPVVCTAVGGLAEIIDGHNGILLPPRDPERWAQEIGDLLADKERRVDMGRRARNDVQATLTAAVWAERVATSYDALLDGPTGT